MLLQRLALRVDESLIIPTELNHDAAKRNTISILHRDNPPTAIVARHDVVALGICDACICEGLIVPENMSVTGVANIWNPNILRVPLTTVIHPYTEMAIKGAEILIKMINGEDIKPETITMGAELIVRESTAEPGFESLVD